MSSDVFKYTFFVIIFLPSGDKLATACWGTGFQPTLSFDCDRYKIQLQLESDLSFFGKWSEQGTEDCDQNDNKCNEQISSSDDHTSYLNTTCEGKHVCSATMFPHPFDCESTGYTQANYEQVAYSCGSVNTGTAHAL